MLKSGKISLSGEDMREGLVGVLGEDADLELSRTKHKLVSSEVKGIVDQAAREAVFLAENPGFAKSILNKAIEAKSARKPLEKRASLRDEKGHSTPQVCRVSWRIVRNEIQLFANSILRATPRVAQLSRHN